MSKATERIHREKAMAWWNELPMFNMDYLSKRMLSNTVFGREPYTLTGSEIEKLWFSKSGVWICTDPDEGQYRMDRGEDVTKEKSYIFTQKGYELEIDLKEYTEDDIQDIINGYGYYKEGELYLNDSFNKDSEDAIVTLDIIAECVFEFEFANYGDFQNAFGDEDEE